MPPVRSIAISSGAVTISDFRGSRTFTYATVPSTLTTSARAETFLNAWLSTNITGYQAVAHVFSRSPLQVTIYTANLGVQIPANWWQDA